MEKILFATFEGRHLSTDEILRLPPNTRIKIIIETEETEAKSDNGKGQVTKPEDVEKTKDKQKQDSDKLIQLLQSWREEDSQEEQQETWTYLKHVLDEDRLSNRRFFP